MEDRSRNLNIIVLEPYYGGSHKVFLQSLNRNLPFTFQFYTLPARKWKWRMRLSGPYFAEILNNEPSELFQNCRILCSTFVDVAALRSLLKPSIRQVPVLTYFHENQFAYPVQVDDERDFHFALTNYTTALASDRIAFNSRYNQDTFIGGINDVLTKGCDMNLPEPEQILAKTSVLFPPVEFKTIDSISVAKQKGPVVLWNHRWEHDKNPDVFFEALYELDRCHVDFQLIVVGKAFQRRPEVFDQAKSLLKDRLIHFGFVKKRENYFKLLNSADLVVSTAGHEFYGISVIEAVRAGCRPLLPKRLSYPELFPGEYLYDDEEIVAAMIEGLQKGRLSDDTAKELTKSFSWQELKGKYIDWLN